MAHALLRAAATLVRCLAGRRRCRQEWRHGTHECVRHEADNGFGAFAFKGRCRDFVRGPTRSMTVSPQIPHSDRGAAVYGKPACENLCGMDLLHSLTVVVPFDALSRNPARQQGKCVILLVVCRRQIPRQSRTTRCAGLRWGGFAWRDGLGASMPAWLPKPAGRLRRRWSTGRWVPRRTAVW